MASLDSSMAPSSEASASRLLGGTRPAGRGPSSMSAGCGATSLTRFSPSNPGRRTDRDSDAPRDAAVGTDPWISWGSRAACPHPPSKPGGVTVNRMHLFDVCAMRVPHTLRLVTYAMTIDLGAVDPGRL